MSILLLIGFFCRLGTPPPAALWLNHVTDISVDSPMPSRSIIVTGSTNTGSIGDSITTPSIDRLQARTTRRGAPAARSGASDAGIEVTDTGTVLGTVRASSDIEDWTMTVDSNVAALPLGNVIAADVEVGGHIGNMTAPDWADRTVPDLIDS